MSERALLCVASLYCSLASLVFSKAASLAGSRILAYSYGSGLASSLFCIRCRDPHGRFTLASIAEKVYCNRPKLHACRAPGGMSTI